MNEQELGAARVLAEEIFDVDTESATLVYAASSRERHSRRSITGLGEDSLCFLAGEAINRLYDVAGAEIMEYWQMWSRPRWLLGR